MAATRKFFRYEKIFFLAQRQKFIAVNFTKLRGTATYEITQFAVRITDFAEKLQISW